MSPVHVTLNRTGWQRSEGGETDPVTSLAIPPLIEFGDFQFLNGHQQESA